jgi:hypothetical protein
VDLEDYFPQASKDKLLEPIKEKVPMDVFPEIDLTSFETQRVKPNSQAPKIK